MLFIREAGILNREEFFSRFLKIKRALATPAATPVVNRGAVPGGVRKALAAVGNSRPGSKNNQILEDFLSRKAEYERNKARAQQQLANPAAAASPRPPVNAENFAYEQRLRRVRQQNYESRRLIANRNKINVLPPNHRLSKVAALKVNIHHQLLCLSIQLVTKLRFY